MHKLYVFIILHILLISLSAQEIKYLDSFPKDNSFLNIDNPNDFVIDQDEKLFLSDSKKNKLLIYDKNGILINEIVTDNGEQLFNLPLSVVVSKQNKIVVLNQKSKKIIVLSETGKKLFEFGKDDGLEGSFDNPVSIAIDKDDILYIADNGRNEIIKYDLDGLYLGNAKVNNPIDLVIDASLIINILATTEDGQSKVILLESNLVSRTEFVLSNLSNPKAITINAFGEYYIADSEHCQVYKYGRKGNIIGSAIGTKSSSKSPGNFNNPASLFVKSINNEKDELFILDSQFKSIQKYSIESQLKREKIIEKNPKIFIKTEQISSGISFSKYFYSNSKSIFIKDNKSILVRENDETLFVIENNSISQPNAAHFLDGFLFISDSDKNKVFKYNDKGSQIETYGPTIDGYGEIEKLSSFIVTPNGNMFIADEENNEIIELNDKGEYVSKINSIGKDLISEPVELTFSDNCVYILNNEDSYILKFNLEDEILTQVRFPFDNFEIKREHLTSSLDGKIFFSNSVSGVISLYQNAIEVTRFFALNSSENSITKISGLFFDSNNSKLVVADNMSNMVINYTFQFSGNQDLKIAINPLGFSELQWNGDGKKVELYSRNIGEDVFRLVKKNDDTKLVLFNPTDQVLEYAIKKEGSNRYSNVVKDIFSFCKSIKHENPEAAIEYLKQVESLNPTVVQKEMVGIYRTQIDNYKASKQYNRAINTLFELQQINSESFVVYLEKSQLYQRMNKIDAAIDEIETALDKFPKTKELYYQLIQLNIIKSNYEFVISKSSETLNLFPGNETLILYIAEAYDKLKRSNKAIQYYQVLFQQTKKVEYQLAIAKIYVDQRNNAEALKIYENLKNNNDIRAEVFNDMAQLQLTTNDFIGAEKTILEGIVASPANAQLYYSLGLVYLKSNNPNAKDKIEKAVELDENNAEYLVALGDILLDEGEVEDAAYYFESALLEEENNPEILFKLGKLYLNQNKVDYAFGHLLNASILAPQNKEIIGKLDEAKRLRSSLNKDRDEIEFNYIEIRELSNSLIELYENNPFGTITLFNTRNYAINNVLVTIESELFGNKQSFVTLDNIEPNEYADLDFMISIDKVRFEQLVSGNKQVEINFILKYKNQNKKDVNSVHTERVLLK